MKPKRSTVEKDTRTVRLGIYMPEDLHTALMHRCIDERVSATQLVNRLVREYLARSSHKRAGVSHGA